MTSRILHALLAGALLAATISTTAKADDCKLTELASFDFTMDNGIAIPVSVKGVQKRMILDTDASASIVDPNAARELELVTERMMQGTTFNRMGLQFTYAAKLPNFDIGPFHTATWDFMVSPSPLSDDGSVAGAIGYDVMGHYDIDIDFGAKKVNLFSQDHCPGKVVYWQNDGVAIVPMRLIIFGTIIVPVKLDGRDIDAELDTGSMQTVLSLESAHLFGLTPASPDMVNAGNVSGAVTTTAYRHTFRSLAIGGLTIGNPNVYIWENMARYGMQQSVVTGTRISGPDELNGLTDLSLGLGELQHLHIYIAYKEKKLYISAAGAPPVAAAASAPGAAAASAPATTATAH